MAILLPSATRSTRCWRVPHHGWHWRANRRLSPKTRWNILAAFHSFLGWLYRREEIRELPRHYPWPKPPERTPAPLSARTQDEILDAIPKDRRGIYLAITLMSACVPPRPSRSRWPTTATAGSR